MGIEQRTTNTTLYPFPQTISNRRALYPPSKRMRLTPRAAKREQLEPRKLFQVIERAIAPTSTITRPCSMNERNLTKKTEEASGQNGLSRCLKPTHPDSIRVPNTRTLMSLPKKIFFLFKKELWLSLAFGIFLFFFPLLFGRSLPTTVYHGSKVSITCVLLWPNWDWASVGNGFFSFFFLLSSLSFSFSFSFLSATCIEDGLFFYMYTKTICKP